MLAMAHRREPSMRDIERELSESIRRRQTDQGDPLEGLFTLTRRTDSDDDDQFDVDMTILDFLTYKAINLVFEWRSSSNPYQSDLPSALVTMTSEWRAMLKHKYDGRRLNNQVAFRSRLLQFVLLFTHRLNHDETWTNEQSLDEIRAQNKSRGEFWQQNTSHSPALRNAFDTSSEFPLSDGALVENRHELASALGMPNDKLRWVKDVEGTPSLQCLLPLFIGLTAAWTELNNQRVPTKDWMNLAGQFMLQAAIEEYLRNGAFGEETFNTIFAFGCPGPDADTTEISDVKAMRKVFCDREDSHKQAHGWAKIKRKYIDELLPQSPSQTHLESMEGAQRRYSYVAFETQMIDFLRYLYDDVAKPDLVQVEEGRITIHGNELPETEAREMLERMGL